MFHYQRDEIEKVLAEIVRQNVSADVCGWLEEKKSFTTTAQFNAAFAMMPRKTGKEKVQITGEQEQRVEAARPGLSIQAWTTDRLARVWLLLQPDATSKETYFQTIENLFLSAEMNELVALYSALPVLEHPELWVKRCAEGIRSNIGDVLQAIMCNNPYPSENLEEAAWNQLVLKAFFTGKPVEQIIGLDERTNPELAGILTDYAHERWAAHRLVNPQLWRCVGPFINKNNFHVIQRMAHSENTVEKEAAALACFASNFPPAKEWLHQNSELETAIESGELTWDSIAEKAAALNY